MNENKYLVDVTSLKPEEIRKSFYLKPKTAIYSSIVIAVIFAFTKLWPLIFFILPLAFVALFKLPDRKIIDITTDAIIIYLSDDPEHAYKARFDEIKSWNLRQSGVQGDALLIQTQDDEVLPTVLFGSYRLARSLYKIMPEKEAGRLRRKAMEENSKPLFGNLFKKWRKKK